MRISWFLVALALAGSTAEAQSQGARADCLRRLHDPTDPKMKAVLLHMDSLAALVDTIVVLSPDSIVLHVGQSEEDDPLNYIRAEGRRASGEMVRGTGEDLSIEDTSIAAYRERRLTGLKMGRTRVVLALVGCSKHAPPSYVPVVVIRDSAR